MKIIKEARPDYRNLEIHESSPAQRGVSTLLKRECGGYSYSYFFPEVEPLATYAYGTVWPLSEDFYLCNFNFGLYLLDRFGNREVIYDPGKGPHRVRDPFPMRPRRMPPVFESLSLWRP